MATSRFLLLRAGAPRGDGNNIIKGKFESGRKSGINFIKGTYKFSPPLRDSMYNIARLLVFYESDDRWELLNSTKWSPCRDMIVPGGVLEIWKKMYFPDLPDTCPVTGNYKIDLKIPVERNNWGPALKLLIPEYVPRGNKYRLSFTYYYKDGKVAGMFIIDFKLYQKSRKQPEEKVAILDINDLIKGSS